MSNLTAFDFQKMFEKPVSAQQRYEMERPVPEARAIPSYSERRKNSAFDYVPTRGELRGSIFDLAHDLGLSPRASRKTSEFLIGTPSGTDDSAMPIPDIGALDFVTGTAAKRFVDPLMMADAQQFRLDDDPTMSTLMAGLAVFPPAAYAVKGGQAFGKEVSRLAENALTTNPGATSVEAVQSRYVHALSGAKTPPGGVCHDAACKMADSINPGDQIRTFTVDGRQPSHSILTDAKGNVKADSFKGKGRFNPKTGRYFDSRFGEEHRPMAVTDAFAAKKAGERLAQPKVSAADFDPSRRGFMQGAGLAAVATQLPAPLLKMAGEVGAGMREVAGIPGAAKVAGTAAKAVGKAVTSGALSKMGAMIPVIFKHADNVRLKDEVERLKNFDVLNNQYVHSTGETNRKIGGLIKEKLNPSEGEMIIKMDPGNPNIINSVVEARVKKESDGADTIFDGYVDSDEYISEYGEDAASDYIRDAWDDVDIRDEYISETDSVEIELDKMARELDKMEPSNVHDIEYKTPGKESRTERVSVKEYTTPEGDFVKIYDDIYFKVKKAGERLAQPKVSAPEQISKGRRDFMGQVPGAALAGAGIAALGVPAAVKLAGKIGGGITGIPGAAKVAGTAAKAVASKIVVSPAMMALAKGANRYIDSDDVPDDFMSGISDTRDLSFSLGHDFPDSKLGRDIDMGGNDFSSGFVEMEKFLDEKLGDAADFSESIYSVNTKYLDDALYYSEDGNTNEYIGMLKSALKREPISTNEFDGIILKEIDIDGDIAILAEDVEKSKWPRLLFKLKETNLK
jgi:hypothetical protein